MNRARYFKLLVGLSADITDQMRQQVDMLEIDEPDAEVPPKEVTGFADRVRERLLWIERAAHDNKSN